MFDHLHAVANDVSFRHPVNSPQFYLLFPPPENAEEISRAFQADPVRWDPEGEALRIVNMNSHNRSDEVCGWELNSKQPEMCRSVRL